MSTLAVYRRLVGARLRSDLQYRTSFFLFLAGQTLVGAADFLAIVVIFGRVDSLSGWSAFEVALLFGLSGVAFGLGDLFVSQVETVAQHIKAGTFDAFLVRPFGALWQLSATEFAPRRLGRTVQPLVVLAIAIPRLDIDWTVAHVVLVPLTVMSGFAIYGAIWVLTSSVSFWSVETQEMANSFTYGGNTLTSYPVDVFSGVLQRIVIFVVPVAFVAYFPAVELLGKPMPFDLPRWVAWLGPVVAALLVALTRAVWKLALRHYRSTGS